MIYDLSNTPSEIKEERSFEERERLFNSHLNIVRSTAHALHSNIDPELLLNVDDLYALGLGGLWKATERYTGKNGASFATFAEWRVKGAMLDAIRLESRRRQILKDVYFSPLRSSFGFTSECDAVAEREVHMHERAKEVHRALNRLSTKQKSYVVSYYLDSRDMKDVAKDHRVTEGCVSLVLKRAREILREHLVEVAY